MNKKIFAIAAASTMLASWAFAQDPKAFQFVDVADNSAVFVESTAGTGTTTSSASSLILNYNAAATYAVRSGYDTSIAQRKYDLSGLTGIHIEGTSTQNVTVQVQLFVGFSTFTQSQFSANGAFNQDLPFSGFSVPLAANDQTYIFSVTIQVINGGANPAGTLTVTNLSTYGSVTTEKVISQGEAGKKGGLFCNSSPEPGGSMTASSQNGFTAVTDALAENSDAITFTDTSGGSPGGNVFTQVNVQGPRNVFSAFNSPMDISDYNTVIWRLKVSNSSLSTPATIGVGGQYNEALSFVAGDVFNATYIDSTPVTENAFNQIQFPRDGQYHTLQWSITHSPLNNLGLRHLLNFGITIPDPSAGADVYTVDYVKAVKSNASVSDWNLY